MNIVEQQLEEKSRNAEQSILNGQWQFNEKRDFVTPFLVKKDYLVEAP